MGEYGDKSVTFNAKVAGKATVTAKNIIITDENTNVLEQGKTKVHSMTVTEKKSRSTTNKLRRVKWCREYKYC